MLVRSSVKITVCLQKVRTKLTRFETNFKIENLFRLAELIQSTGVYRGARIKDPILAPRSRCQDWCQDQSKESDYS